MANKVTIADVARQAGVSRMTVSRVINNKDGVREGTRRRIEAVIQELDYRPNSIARSLVTQRTCTLGLVVQDISNPFFSGITRGIEQVARANGYSVLLCNAEEDPSHESKVLEVLEEKRVDGVVLCSSRMDQDQLRQALTLHPIVVLVNRTLENEDHRDIVDAAVIDEQTGGYLATRHLLSLGHTTIGFLSGPTNSYGNQGRTQGYQEAIETVGLSYNPELTFRCAPTVEGGTEGALKLLGQHPDISALFCYNDLVGVGALLACTELGRRVPEDMAIVGYDDIRLAALVTPPLTTCRVPREKLGQIAGNLLLDRIRGRPEGFKRIVVQPKLIVRESAPHVMPV